MSTSLTLQPLLELLAQTDGWTGLRVLVAAGFYASALVAVGGLLFRLVFGGNPEWDRATGLRTLVPAAAALALVLLLLQWPLQAGFLGGGSWAAAIDPSLLALVFEGAAGQRMLLAGGGLLLLLGAAVAWGRGRGLGTAASLLGAALVLLSFTWVGHSTGEPRLLLASLLLLHLVGLAFWVGALLPLYRISAPPHLSQSAGRVLQRFGQVAAPVLAALIAAALLLAWRLLEGWAPLLHSAYGQVLLLKLAVLGLLLGLAGLNRWLLVPAFVARKPLASQRLRASIGCEGLLVGLILLLTAVLTTTTSPTG
ncbi:CopD family protein [Serpentinimonas barnesii]|uniref:CopD family protein n=1 Tax=Serpentinimonas barnesii TaxID=1458427 RepID=UPI0005EFE75B|nr:CopD family protein [Serpentinimonas barnesii]